MENTVDEKKRLGVYYTPERVASILANWAIRSPKDQVLEPSFGRCGFLQAVVDELEAKGCERAIHNIYGYDVDDDAFEGPYESLVRENGASSQFHRADFLKATPVDLGGRKFNVAIGNPPYVSYHNMDEEQRQTAAQAIRESDFSLDKRASLWAYFVLHTFAFLREGGRIAWVLPWSFFHADYSSTVIEAVTGHFERATAFQLGERIFQEEGAKEHSVILLAEGWQADTPCEELRVGYAPFLDDLSEMIEAWENGEWEGKVYDSAIGGTFMRPEVSESIQYVKENCRVRSLGDVIQDVKIGIVTGDNQFFVISRSEVENYGLQAEDWKHIFAKSKISRGVSLSKQDFKEAYQAGHRCVLIDAKTPVSEELEKYLKQKPREEIESNATFGKRSDWRLPDDENEPDAFFTYMQSLGPRLILNQAGVNSTNTIHRVYFDEEFSDVDRKALAVSLLSTFSRLSAEVEGRTYGSGVLKLEIGETRSLQVALPPDWKKNTVEKAYKEVDLFLREGSVENAKTRANKFVFQGIPKKKRTEIIQSLQEGLQNARRRRRGK
jgi:adenine-specific DNA methylase